MLVLTGLGCQALQGVVGMGEVFLGLVGTC